MKFWVGTTDADWFRFLPKEFWLPDPPGWSPNIVRGRMYDREQVDGEAIWAALGPHMAQRQSGLVREAVPTGLQLPLVVTTQSAYGPAARIRPRLGQGAFRLLLTDLYKRRCAITGESTLPVLDAAHIVPFAESASHDLSNGLLLRADFHKLFDAGLVGVSPDLTVRVSPRIRDQWFNGKAYYRLDGQPLAVVPDHLAHRPDPDRLDWHLRNIFQA